MSRQGHRVARRIRGKMNTGALTLLVLSLLARQTAANERIHPRQASPKGRFYAVALYASTLAYRPPGGPFQGPQKDIAPAVGAGYFLSDALAVGLEVGPTFVGGDYTSFGVRPALSWRFHRIMYVAGRLVVPVDPEINLVVLPAFGVTHTFAGAIAPFFEIALQSAVGRGDPDLGLVHTLGLTYLF